MNRNFVVPIVGDMLCIKHSNGEWAYSGDRFERFEGTQIIAKKTYANGKETFIRGDETKFRVLRGIRLFHIYTPTKLI